MHMLPHLASRRACASSKIDMKALRAVTRFAFSSQGSEDQSQEEEKKLKKEAKKRFWKVIESFSNEDRSLFIKFATGRQRLAQGDDMTVNLTYGDSPDDGRLPTAGTCGNYIDIPNYSSEEILSNNLLIAIRLCGEIDNDGGGEYGSEYGEEQRDGDEANSDNSNEPNFSLVNFSLDGNNQDNASENSESRAESEGSQQDEEEKDEGIEGTDTQFNF